MEPGLPSPQSATSTVTWRAIAAGGAGRITFEFESRRNGGPQRKERSGPVPLWKWTPGEIGRYEVRVLATDNDGKVAASRWSEPYEIKPPRIAVLPFENLSETPAPLKEMRAFLMDRLRKRGVKLLDEEELLSMMARHRIRFTGGIDNRLAEGFRKETGVEGVLITSLVLYTDQNPPRMALVSRLAGTDTPSIVVWADSVSLAGDDSPGILELGLLENMGELMPKVLDRLAGSLAGYLGSEKSIADRKRLAKRFRPSAFYRSPVLRSEKSYRIAVLPIVNHSPPRNAGHLLALNIVEQLGKTGGFEVLEPGFVREELLQLRIVTPEGASLDVADILFERLKVDLLFTGKVMDYEDTRGGSTAAPKVTFFAQVIERQSKEVVWASHSTNRGDDGVFFFDVGKVTTAHALASNMVAEIIQGMRLAED